MKVTTGGSQQGRGVGKKATKGNPPWAVALIVLLVVFIGFWVWRYLGPGSIRRGNPVRVGVPTPTQVQQIEQHYSRSRADKELER